MVSSQEGKSRRKFHRNTTQRVIVIIDEAPYLVKDWSPDGISFIQKNNNYSSGDIIMGQIDIYELEDIGNFTGKVIQTFDNGFVSAQFVDISSHIFLNLCMTVSLIVEDVAK
ncbi:MAG: PilZ domain-containing protein [Sneathiella sp.]|nr:PilZ domain-containing protein [Sneathiella sp.]